jgi:hypothetical protein
MIQWLEAEPEAEDETPSPENSSGLRILRRL